MASIVIGQTKSGRACKMDIEVLLRTRLLVQANSGQGKSYLLRRLAEQLFGKVQLIIVDPEGEFATLREKFDFVLIGEGGDAPIHVPSAKLLAHRLLELRASAICNIYDGVAPAARHEWVRNFVDGLVESPKKLWHSCVVVIDEAHKFAPERKAGESCALEAVTKLASDGRKRGFAAVLATQRLAKLDKNVSAEMLNRLVGGTFEDVDIDRAVDLLGVARVEMHEFRKALKVMEPGEFYAVGRAITKEMTLLKVGEVTTHHPDSGHGPQISEPPPPTKKVKELLAKLADLPQAAAKKEQTEKELKAEIRQLHRQLRDLPKVQPVTTIMQDPKLAAAHAALQELVEDMYKVIVDQRIRLEKHSTAFTEQATKITGEARTLAEAHRLLDKIEKQMAARVRKLSNLPVQGKRTSVENVDMRTPYRPPAPVHRPEPASSTNSVPAEGTNVITGPMRKILTVLAELAAIGKDTPAKEMVAGWAGYSPTSGGYANTLGMMRTAGLISYPVPGTVALTAEGNNRVDPMPSPSQEEVQRRILSVCSGPERKILEFLMSRPNQGSYSKTDVARETGYSETSGGYANTLGMLRTKGFIDYPQKGFVKPAEWLFID